MSSAKVSFKPRKAPTPQALHAQQLHANKMLLLDNAAPWVADANYSTDHRDEPATPLAAPVAVVVEVEVAAPPVAPIKVAATPQYNWDLTSPEAVHPYHVVLPEKLFQKMDWTWKRKGFRSAREFVIQTLEAAVTKAIKEEGK